MVYTEITRIVRNQQQVKYIRIIICFAYYSLQRIYFSGDLSLIPLLLFPRERDCLGSDRRLHLKDIIFSSKSSFFLSIALHCYSCHLFFSYFFYSNRKIGFILGIAPNTIKVTPYCLFLSNFVVILNLNNILISNGITYEFFDVVADDDLIIIVIIIMCMLLEMERDEMVRCLKMDLQKYISYIFCSNNIKG